MTLEEIPAHYPKARIGLLAHPASVDAQGRHTADRLLAAGGNLVVCFGPEHGYFGWGGAGEKLGDGSHPFLGIPVRSLYGEYRKPPPEWMDDLDVLVVDLQDIGVRCFTFISTLRYVLESAAETGTPVVIHDRPVPLPGTLDGPMLAEDCRSFVGLVDTPFLYGMTPGEAAGWICERYQLRVDLKIILCTEAFQIRTPPSPAIRSWACAVVYPATVFCEALPLFESDRSGPIPFQSLSGEGLDPLALINILPEIPGASVFPHMIRMGSASLPGIRFAIIEPALWRPVACGVTVLAALQQMLGSQAVWEHPGKRSDFFDKLYGTTAVRAGLQAGRSAAEIVASWQPDLDAFAAERHKHRLYGETG